jgi:elongation factor P
MTISATQLRVGMIIVHERNLYRVSSVRHLTPGNKRGFMQTKLKNLRTGAGAEEKFRSEDRIERATLENRAMAYLYRDGDSLIFMDMETYEQISLSAELVGELLGYLLPGQTVQIEFYDGGPVGISLAIQRSARGYGDSADAQWGNGQCILQTRSDRDRVDDSSTAVHSSR